MARNARAFDQTGCRVTQFVRTDLALEFRLEHYQRQRTLAPLLVRYADHRDFLHGIQRLDH